jgi:hypothetical protein
MHGLAGIALNAHACQGVRQKAPHHVQHVARFAGVQLELDLAPNDPVVALFGTFQAIAAEVLNRSKACQAC